MIPMRENRNKIAEKKLSTLSFSSGQAIRSARQALFEKGLPADRFLSEFYRNHHQYGSRDRRVITSCVFSFFRWYGLLTRVFNITGDTIPEEALCAALASDDPYSPLLSFYFDPAFLQKIQSCQDPIDRFCIVTRIGTQKELTVRDLVPDWVPEKVIPSGLQPWLDGLRTKSPLWIRVRGIPTEEMVRRLQKGGIEAETHPGTFHQAVKIITPNVHLESLPPELMIRGHYEVQDYSSQCIVFPANPRPGETWWDCCCGAGGKTLQLADAAGDAIRIIASDIREEMYPILRKRAAAAGLFGICVQPFPRAEKRQYDGVVVDAPCTASGRWRRNPEMRWILTPGDLLNSAKRQMEILEHAARCVRPGGKLVYGTCSVFEAENTEIVHHFLLRKPEFKLKPFPSPHDGTMTDGTLLTLPVHGNCDSSYTALFVREGKNQ